MVNDENKIIKFSNSGSFSTQYEELRKTILSKFSNVEVSGQEYPLGNLRFYLSKALTIIQYTFIAYSLLGKWLKNYLPFIPESIFNVIQEKKFFTIIFYVVINMIQNKINSTGAFEIFLDNKIVKNYF